MPLLKGRFDPKRFNAVAIARAWNKSDLTLNCPWEQLNENYKQALIDWAQQMLNNLVEEKIIR